VCRDRAIEVTPEGPAATPVPIAAAAVSRLGNRRRKVLGASAGVVAIAAGLLLWKVAPWRAPLSVSSYVQLTHDGQPKWLVGTDGVRLFLGTGTVLDPGLAEMPIDGGEASLIPIPRSGLRPLALAPKGDAMLLSDYYPANLWSLRLVGGALQRLGEAVGAEAAWSRDGRRLAYCDAEELWVAASDGSERRKLLKIPNRRLFALEWSPDATRLRFTLWRGGEAPSLWEVSADGNNLHQLLPNWHRPPDEQDGHWTPDGRYYIFQSRSQLWALRDGQSLPFLTPHRPIQLTSSPFRMASPLPGRDGKKLYAIGRTERGTLVRYDGVKRRFEPYLGGISAEYVGFSKDGEWLAYVTYPEGVLWRCRKDGTGRLRLANPAAHPVLPRWSGNGMQIAFSFRSDEGLGLTYLIPAGGGEPEQLFREGPPGLGDPNWSPDGQRMVLSYDKGSPPLEVWMTGPGCKNPARMPGGVGRYGGRWSPDGRRIVAMKQNPIGLSLFDVQTGEWSELAIINGGFPNWSHDGKYVYFLRFPDHPAVVRIDVARRKVETVVDLDNFHMTGSMSAWLGLTPDDSPLLLRDAGTQDVYAMELTQ